MITLPFKFYYRSFRFALRGKNVHLNRAVRMTLPEKENLLSERLASLKNGQDRLAFVVAMGRQSPPLPVAVKTDAHRVEGCMAKVWFAPEWREGRCYFLADSDSAIVKGIAVLLCEHYSGQTPEEILSHHPGFLEKFGITQHLTPNRRNSLRQIWKGIENFARAHEPVRRP